MQLHGDGARLRVLWRPRVVKRYLESTDTPRLHIGCGGRHVAGWLNVDKFAGNADTYLNATTVFPFADNSFDKIFTEHTIEHLPIEKIRLFLSEIFRVLKPGGVLRVTCPDLELYARNYVAGDQAFFDKVLEGVEWKRRKDPEAMWVVRTRGGAFMSNAVRNFHKHRWMYDYDTLSSCLKEVGFTETVKQTFGTSIDPDLAAMDNRERSFETLYIDARKA
jgi:predicted SAM-dependent methyltransferase